MKKLIILFIAAMASGGIFAKSPIKVTDDASARIKKVFHHNFPEVDKSSMTKVDNYYIVSFKTQENQVSCRIFYDTSGNAIQTIRTYEAGKLVPFIRSKVDSKYKGKQIFMVTDVATENEHYYEIMLQDSKSLWIVHANNNGSMFIQKRFKRTI